MTLINRLIKEARAQPQCLKIRPQDVGAVAEHVHQTAWFDGRRPTREEAREIVQGGRLTLRGVPVVVIGRPPATF